MESVARHDGGINKSLDCLANVRRKEVPSVRDPGDGREQGDTLAMRGGLRIGVKNDATEGVLGHLKRCPDAAKALDDSCKSFPFNGLQSGGGGNRTRTAISLTISMLKSCNQGSRMVQRLSTARTPLVVTARHLSAR
jgi:hypothetical protein